MTDGPRVAVVGVGNPIMGDDGVGEAVVGALRDEGLPPAVDATHAGTTAFFALEAMHGADFAVVVDAVATGEAPPGSIHRYRYRDGAFEGTAPEVLMHDFSFSAALRTGRDAYEIPMEIVVIGVEPATTETGLELSDPVEASLPRVVDAVEAEITEHVDAADRREVSP